jgi:hypothetical protein
MRLNLKQLQELAKKKGLTVRKTNGTLFKYEIFKAGDTSSAYVEYARNAGEAEYEIENWQ